VTVASAGETCSDVMRGYSLPGSRPSAEDVVLEDALHGVRAAERARGYRVVQGTPLRLDKAGPLQERPRPLRPLSALAKRSARLRSRLTRSECL